MAEKRGGEGGKRARSRLAVEAGDVGDIIFDEARIGRRCIMFVVISYDIADDRRRLKVAQTLLDFGGERVQRSVFECYITERNYERLQRRASTAP